MGDANMAFMGALETVEGARAYHTRDEHIAIGMAEGYAYAGGKVGVASVTCGPGVTQTATALMMASRQRVPLVVLAGEAPPGHIQYMDQPPFVRACESIFERVRSASTVYADVRHAFHTARTERKPVLLTLPLGLQAREVDEQAPSGPWPSAMATEPLTPNEASVNAAANEIARAHRVVIVAGRGAVASGAIDGIERLADRTGALLATSLFAFGAFGAHPRYAGIAGGYTFEGCREALAEADCVVSVGASLNHFTTDDGRLFPAARTVQIDIDPLALVGDERPADVLVLGDARKAVAAVLEELKRRDHRSDGYAVAPDRQLLREARDAYLEERAWHGHGGIDPREVVVAIDRVIPDDAVTAIGGGHFWAFPTSFLTPRRDGPTLFGLGFGSIGHGVLVGLGAAAALPERPVVVFEGDASMLMNIASLETAGRYGLRVLIVVLNDEALGAEYHKLAEFGLDPALAASASPDLAAIATGFGVRGIRVDNAAALTTALAGLFPLQGPVLIDARVTREVRSVLHIRGRPG